MESDNNFDILIEAFLTEMPHVKLHNGDYIDVLIENIPHGDKIALRHRLKEILSHQPDKISTANSLKNSPDILAVIHKYFDMRPIEYVAMLKDVLKDIFKEHRESEREWKHGL